MGKTYMSYAFFVTLLLCLCCSQYGWCGKTDAYRSPFKNCQSVGGGVGQSGTNVLAYWDNYRTVEYDWDLRKANVYCSQWSEFADKPHSWRSKYGWAAFCGPVGSIGWPSCGKCLKVKNTRNNAEETVRIVDECHNGGLVLDYTVFHKLADSLDITYGNIKASYEFVDCGDDFFNNLLEVV